MAVKNLGPYEVSATRTKEGHREYKVKSKVQSGVNDGPSNVMTCPGLYAIGSTYSIRSDSDSWAFCWPTMSITKHGSWAEGEKVLLWNVEQTFSTEPLWRCNTTQIQDPLQEPIKLSGGFVKYTREASVDMNNLPITNSAWELFRGQQNEWDANRPNVHVEMNQASLGLSTFSQMIDTVNNAPLWGLPVRCIKLSSASWERKLFGVCSYYYTVGYDFDVMYETFDRYLIDTGNRVIQGSWGTDGKWAVATINGSPANVNDPTHFMTAIDRSGNPTEIVLDGYGRPWDSTGTGSTSSPGVKLVQYYPASNFLLLNVPTSL